jgi:hypothetical protein
VKLGWKKGWNWNQLSSGKLKADDQQVMMMMMRRRRMRMRIWPHTIPDSVPYVDA